LKSKEWWLGFLILALVLSFGVLSILALGLLIYFIITDILGGIICL